jgi:hypothetical protein
MAKKTLKFFAVLKNGKENPEILCSVKKWQIKP